MSNISYLYDLTAKNFDQITVDNTGAGIPLTSAYLKPTDGELYPKQCILAVLQVETAEIRYRIDGGVPTSLIGTKAKVGDIIEVFGYNNLKNFKAIRTGGSNGQLNVHYFYAI